MAPAAPQGQRYQGVASVTLNANGYGFCTVTIPSGLAVTIKLASVSTAAAALPNANQIVQPTCTLYLDSQPNISKYLESTPRGDGRSSNSEYELMGGESVTAEWVCTGLAIAPHAGILATLVLRGFQRQTAVM